MSSANNQTGTADSTAPQPERGSEPAAEVVWQTEETADAPSLLSGIVRRARLRSFPEAEAAPAYAYSRAPQQTGWVVESQIAEDFGVEEAPQSQGVIAEPDWAEPPAPYAPAFETSAPADTPTSAPASAPETLDLEQPTGPQPVVAPSEPPSMQLVKVPAPDVPRSMADLPDSAYRKLSPLEAQYIASMRNWIKEESGKPGSPLAQAAPDEQVQLALTALNNELTRKLQSRLPASFASLAQAYLFGWGPLDHLMRLEEVTEVMVNGAVSIFIERRGRLEPAGPGLDDETIYTIAERMTGRRPTIAEPMLDDRLRDGSRLNATHASISMLGATLSIRRFPQVALLAEDLVQSGALTPELLRFLETMVRGRVNIIISGGTNTGKTTLLNVLLGAIPATQRLVIIEQAPAEIRCSLPNRAHLLTRPRTADGAAEISVTALVRNALRMRPDRIVVGECRGGEALAMLQAMNTGHSGSLTTLHANNPFDALSRLETMVLMAESGLPHDAIRGQIARAIQLVVQTRRDQHGRRYVSEVVQITPSNDSVSGYATTALFEARLEQGTLVCRRTRTALDQHLFDQMVSYGLRPDEIAAVTAVGSAR